MVDAPRLLSPRLRWSLAATAALLALAGPFAAGEDSAPPFIVRDTRAAALALETAEADLAGSEPRRGLTGLQHVLDDVRDDLVVEWGDAFQTRWIAATEAALRRLERLGPSFAADYEMVAGPSARAALERAAPTREELRLGDVFARYPFTAAGVEAAKLLAESAFERGAARDAAATLRRALRFARGDPAVWRRLVDALDAAGDGRRLAALELPDAMAADPATADLVARLSAARARTALSIPGQLDDDAAAAHATVPPIDHRLRPLRWTAGAAMPIRGSDEGFGLSLPDEDGNSRAGFLDRRRRIAPFFPALAGRTVVVADGFSVSALDLLSGRAAWTFPRDDRPMPGLPITPRGRGFLPGRTHLDVSHRPFVAGATVYAVVETDTPYVPRLLNQIEITTYRPRRVLVALDAATGELRWFTGRSDEDAKALGSLSVASDPVVSGGLATVVLTTWEKRWRVYLAAFDAESGALRWKREIVGGQQELNLFGEPVRDLFAGTPAIADEVVYAATGLGVFAAVALRTGDVQWLSSYEATQLERVQVWYLTPMRFATWGPSPVVVAGDAVLAAPAESPHLLCFDRADGRLRWRETSEARRGSSFVDQFLGVASDGRRDLAIVTGRSVKALLLSTGQSVWKERLPDGARSRGRGAISTSTVYVPTVQGLSRWSLAAEGRFLGEDAWPAGAQPGNVCLFPEVLVVAGGRFDDAEEVVAPTGPIQAFYDWEEVEARLAARRAESPADPDVILDEADLWRVVGKDARAEPLYEEGRKLAEAVASAPHLERARRGIYLLRRDRGDAFAAARRVPEARSAYERALASATAIEDRVEIRLRLDRMLDAASLEGARVRNLEALAAEAKDAHAVLDPDQDPQPVRVAARLRLATIHRAAGRMADAVDALQAMLEDDTDVVLAGEPVRLRATREIASIVREVGPEPYAKHEREAKRRLEAALAAVDTAPFERLLAVYPNATIVPGAMIGLGDRLHRAGSAAEAAGFFRRFLAAYPDRQETPSVFARLARALIDAKSVAPARATIATLERRYPDASFTLGDRTTTGAEFARAERARLGPPPSVEPERALTTPVSERLHETIDTDRAGARVIPILRTAGSSAGAPVLLDIGADVAAIDPESGTVRFRKPWDRVGLAALVGDVLVLSRPGALLGVDPRSGEETWTREIHGTAIALDGGLGQVLVVVKPPGDRLRTQVLALDPVTADVLWQREIREDPVESLAAGEDGFVLVRRRTIANAAGGTRMFLVLSIHALLTGEPVREVPLLSEGFTDAAWRLVDPHTVCAIAREPKGLRIDAIDLGTGLTRWSKVFEGSARLRHLLTRTDAVVLIDLKGEVNVLASANGDVLRSTAITGGVDTLYGADPIVEGDQLYALLRTGPSSVLAAFDLATGRARFTVPTSSPVNTGWMRKSGDVLVTIQAPQRTRQMSSPSHLIALVDARTGGVVHTIDGEGLSGWQPSAALVDGALVVVGERAFAVYR